METCSLGKNYFFFLSEIFFCLFLYWRCLVGLLFGVGAGVGGCRMFNQSSKHRAYLLGTGHVLPSTIFVVGGICTRFFPPQSRFLAFMHWPLPFAFIMPHIRRLQPHIRRIQPHIHQQKKNLTVTLLCKCTTTIVLLLLAEETHQTSLFFLFGFLFFLASV